MMKLVPLPLFTNLKNRSRFTLGLKTGEICRLFRAKILRQFWENCYYCGIILTIIVSELTHFTLYEVFLKLLIIVG